MSETRPSYVIFRVDKNDPADTPERVELEFEEWWWRNFRFAPTDRTVAIKEV